MHPVLIDTFVNGYHIHLSSYRAMAILGSLLAITFALFLSRRYGFPLRKMAVIVAVIAVGMFAGSRLLNVVLNPSVYQPGMYDPWQLSLHGFSMYGGLLAAMAGGYAACVLLGLNPWRVGDMLAPVLGLFLACIRTGCFLAGCCFGKITKVPWGVVFPKGSSAFWAQTKFEAGRFVFPDRVLPVHPTQIYEGAAALLGGIVAFWLLEKRRLPSGTVFLGFFLWFTAVRWTVYYFRVMPGTFSAPPWFYPAFYAGIIAVTAALIRWRCKKPAD